MGVVLRRLLALIVGSITGRKNPLNSEFSRTDVKDWIIFLGLAVVGVNGSLTYALYFLDDRMAIAVMFVAMGVVFVGRHARKWAAWVTVVMPDHYAAFDHGYACTIHKSQGATVNNAYVLGSGTMDHHLSYVAMTRHRDEMRLYGEPAALRRLERNHDSEVERSALHLDHQHKRSGPRR